MFKMITGKASQLQSAGAGAIMKKVKGLLKDENGQGMAEYGLIIALIAVVVIVALTLMGQRILAKFNNVNDALN